MLKQETFISSSPRSERDVLFYYTTVGWMMWNWLVSALAIGTTIVLYDGSPLHPHPSVRNIPNYTQFESLWYAIRVSCQIYGFVLVQFINLP